MILKTKKIMLIQFALIALFLAGCSGMSTDWGVGFMQGVRTVPQHDFTLEEKERAIAAKKRFERPFTAELKRKLEENELADLKGWLVFFDFFSDGTIKTANVWLYTYWGPEQRYNVYSVPMESFLDNSQLQAIVDESTQEVASMLQRKAAFRYQQTVD
ncbi:MAG: hypothetical protein ACYSRP_09600 [Planctomycetota bacterium]|jgi:hypothetical protein